MHRDSTLSVGTTDGSEDNDAVGELPEQFSKFKSVAGFARKGSSLEHSLKHLYSLVGTLQDSAPAGRRLSVVPTETGSNYGDKLSDAGRNTVTQPLGFGANRSTLGGSTHNIGKLDLDGFDDEDAETGQMTMAMTNKMTMAMTNKRTSVLQGPMNTVTLKRKPNQKQRLVTALKDIQSGEKNLRAIEAAAQAQKKAASEELRKRREQLEVEAAAHAALRRSRLASLRQRGLISPVLKQKSPTAATEEADRRHAVLNVQSNSLLATLYGIAEVEEKERELPRGCFSASTGEEWDPRVVENWWAEASMWADGHTWWGWMFGSGLEEDKPHLDVDSCLAWAADGGCLETCQLMVSQQADVNSECRRKMTSLMLASANGHTHVVQYLLTQRADADAVDSNGKGALHRAVYRGHAGATHHLLRSARIGLELRKHLLDSARLFGAADCEAELSEMCAEVHLWVSICAVSEAEPSAEKLPALQQSVRSALGQTLGHLGVRSDHVRFPKQGGSRGLVVVPRVRRAGDASKQLDILCAIALVDATAMAVTLNIEAILARESLALHGQPFQVHPKDWSVAVDWPGTTVLRDAWESCACDLEGRLEEVLEAVKMSAAAFQPVHRSLWKFEWNAMLRLLRVDSRAPYGSMPFMTATAARKKGMARTPFQQVAGKSLTLASLDRSARAAQRVLKCLIAPNMEWADTAMNSVQDVPADDKSRILQDAGGTVGCSALDPGVKELEVLKQKAAALARKSSPKLPYHLITDACQVRLIYDTVSGLLDGFAALKKKLSVCAVDNHFRYLPPHGYGDLKLTIRIPLQGDDSIHGPYHIGTVTLELAEMVAARQASSEGNFQRLRTVLLKRCGVPPTRLQATQETIFHLLDTVEGCLMQRDAELQQRRKQEEQDEPAWADVSDAVSLLQAAEQREPDSQDDSEAGRAKQIALQEARGRSRGKDGGGQHAEVIMVLIVKLKESTGGQATWQGRQYSNASFGQTGSDLASDSSDLEFQEDPSPAPARRQSGMRMSGQVINLAERTSLVQPGGGIQGMRTKSLQGPAGTVPPSPRGGPAVGMTRSQPNRQSVVRGAGSWEAQPSVRRGSTAPIGQVEAQPSAKRFSTAPLGPEAPRSSAAPTRMSLARHSGGARDSRNLALTGTAAGGSFAEGDGRRFGGMHGHGRDSTKMAAMLSQQPPLPGDSAYREKKPATLLWAIVRARLPVLMAVAESLGGLGVHADHVALTDAGEVAKASAESDAAPDEDCIQEEDEEDDNRRVFMLCKVSLRDAAPLAAKWALQDALENKSSAIRGSSHFEVDAKSCALRVAWPLVVVASEAQDFYLSSLDHDRLWQMASAAEAMSVAHAAILRDVRESEPLPMATLARLSNLYFAPPGAAATSEELRAQGRAGASMPAPEQPMLVADTLMANAVEGQAVLKEIIAPGTVWAATDSNGVSTDDAEEDNRYISEVGIARGGYAFDPGVKSSAHLEKEAKELLRMQQLLQQKKFGHQLKAFLRQTQPPFHKIIDLCTIQIAYHTSTALLAGLEALQDALEVCRLENGFRYPPAHGFCEVVVTVRLPVGQDSWHMGQVSLTLIQMLEVQKAEDEPVLKAMRTFLSTRCRLAERFIEPVRSFIMKSMSRIAGEQLRGREGEPQEGRERRKSSKRNAFVDVVDQARKLMLLGPRTIRRRQSLDALQQSVVTVATCIPSNTFARRASVSGRRSSLMSTGGQSDEDSRRESRRISQLTLDHLMSGRQTSQDPTGSPVAEGQQAASSSSSSSPSSDGGWAPAVVGGRIMTSRVSVMKASIPNPLHKRASLLVTSRQMDFRKGPRSSILAVTAGQIAASFRPGPPAVDKPPADAPAAAVDPGVIGAPEKPATPPKEDTGPLAVRKIQTLPATLPSARPNQAAAGATTGRGSKEKPLQKLPSINTREVSKDSSQADPDSRGGEAVKKKKKSVKRKWKKAKTTDFKSQQSESPSGSDLDVFAEDGKET
eukprot:TRINITY_DN4296_c0_g3_i1.p1 TRINITY_DN4296_c0_g3~~TRINITY_DN4296_c0_g3_i1.p1  ORF type:complete len:1971 (-),score=476.44 TRINITY_DN4296_c0_g3_i1:220-6132(-)